jgi:hypothetical protein
VGPKAGLDGRGKNSPPPGFDLRTIEAVASRYTDWAIPAHAHRHMPVLVQVLSLLYLLSNFCRALSVEENLIKLWDVIFVGIVFCRYTVRILEAEPQILICVAVFVASPDRWRHNLCLVTNWPVSSRTLTVVTHAFKMWRHYVLRPLKCTNFMWPFSCILAQNVVFYNRESREISLKMGETFCEASCWQTEGSAFCVHGHISMQDGCRTVWSNTAIHNFSKNLWDTSKF